MTTPDSNHNNESMLYVVSYDIPDDRRRTRVHSALTGFGTWVQYSVFECNLDEQGMGELLGRVDFELDPATDSCRLYRLCEACVGEVRILGRGDRYSEPGYVIV